MTNIEAMKLALDALHVATTPLARDRQTVLEAIAALRQAISEAEQAEQEPVAEVREDLMETIEQLWVYESIPCGTKLYASPIITSHHDSVGVCEVGIGENGEAKFDSFKLTLPKNFPAGLYKLYTAPQPVNEQK